MGRGVRGWLALDAVSQGDVWVEGSVDGGPWTRMDAVNQGDVWAEGSVDTGPWTQEARVMYWERSLWIMACGSLPCPLDGRPWTR